MSESVNVNINVAGSKGESYFDGGLLQLIGCQILGFLVTAFTLGICYPWLQINTKGIREGAFFIWS